LSIFQRAILVEREVGLNDELVGNLCVVQLACDVEQVLLVVDLEHHSVSAIGHISVGRRFTSGVDALGGLQPTGEVGPDDHVVEKGTPHSKGGKWGKGLRSPRVLRCRVVRITDYRLSVVVRVRGPRIGSNAVVVNSSCPKTNRRR